MVFFLFFYPCHPCSSVSHFLKLEPCALVLRTGNGNALAQIAEAFLVAFDAFDDLVYAPLLHLLWPMGIGQQSSSYGDQVAFPIGQRPLRLLRIVHPSDRDHRDVHDLLDRCGQIRMNGALRNW